MKFIKGPPFLTADATIEPNDLLKHAKKFTQWRYIQPNGRALIQHLPTEYEDDDLDETSEERPAWITTMKPTIWLQPTPLGAKEHIKKELNRVEQHLDLTKQQLAANEHLDHFLSDNDFTETIKE